MTIQLMGVAEWERVIEEIGPRLYRYFRYKGANDLASDLTQETFLRLVGSGSRFDSARGPLVAYALGVAQNVWRETLRKRENVVTLDEDLNLIGDHDLYQEIERLDQGEKVKAIVRRLSQVQQDILYFYFDEEITTREISELIKIPEGTVKSHLHRAKETIQKILEKEPL